jgi:hypothetical protein
MPGLHEPAYSLFEVAIVLFLTALPMSWITEIGLAVVEKKLGIEIRRGTAKRTDGDTGSGE